MSEVGGPPQGGGGTDPGGARGVGLWGEGGPRGRVGGGRSPSGWAGRRWGASSRVVEQVLQQLVDHLGGLVGEDRAQHVACFAGEIAWMLAVAAETHDMAQE